MKGLRPRLSTRPLWREEVPIHAADERYVGRRQLTKFLVLTSFGMLAGQVWILARRWFGRGEAPPAAMPIATLGEIPVGGHKLFSYPRPQDHCILIRLGERRYSAFSQKCTHLSCAVYYDAEHHRLECPCHEGFFDPGNGRVLQGPPPRPLPRITLRARRGQIYATGVDLQTGAPS